MFMAYVERCAVNLHMGFSCPMPKGHVVRNVASLMQERPGGAGEPCLEGNLAIFFHFRI